MATKRLDPISRVLLDREVLKLAKRERVNEATKLYKDSVGCAENEAFAHVLRLMEESHDH